MRAQAPARRTPRTKTQASAPRMPAVGVQRVVERPRRRLDAQRAGERARAAAAARRAAAREQDREAERRRRGRPRARARAPSCRRCRRRPRARRPRRARPSAPEPDDAVDEHGRDRLGARAGAPREVDRPHGVAADGGRQHLARAAARRGTSRTASRSPARGGRARRAAVPALGHHERRDDVDGERGAEPAGLESAASASPIWCGSPARAPRRSAATESADLERDAPCAMHGAGQPTSARARRAAADRRRRCRRASARARAAATAPRAPRARRAAARSSGLRARY